MGVDVVAYSGRFSVPVGPGERDWSTLEDGYQEKGDGVAGASAHCDEAGDAEPFLGENAEVEEEHRDLDQRQTGEIEVLVEVVDFEDRGDVVERYCPDVLTQSQIGHFSYRVSFVVDGVGRIEDVQTTDKTDNGMTSSIATVNTASSQPSCPPN